jgi:hypothetical protein
MLRDILLLDFQKNMKWFHGLTVMTPDFESGSPSSTLGETFFLHFFLWQAGL